MKRNHLDEHIKKSLEVRSIEPGERTWSRLNEMLDAEQTVVPSRKRAYYWVAALLVVALLSSVFLFKPTTEEGAIEVVDVTEDVPAGTDSANEKMKEVPVKESEFVVVDTKDGKSPIERKNQKLKSNPRVPNKIIDTSKELVVAVEYEQSEEDKKVDEVVSKILAKSENNEVTDAELEALLMQAQKDIRKNHIIKHTDSLSAMALLLEAETELDQSFKEKVFDALKESFVKVKTAVAERNQ